MKRNNKKDGFQAQLENIKLDLATHKVLLHFQDRKEPLAIHFDKPARRFYFSLIALVVNEMKNRDKPEFIHIRKHEKTLKLPWLHILIALVPEHDGIGVGAGQVNRPGARMGGLVSGAA